MHGYRAGGLTDFAGLYRFYHEQGYDLLVPFQRSHGPSEGKYICFGVKERYDCRDWAEYAVCRAGKDCNLYPVSYTHLDVYKRQPYNISYEEVCAEVMGPKQKEQLRRMSGFRCKRHESRGLPEEHLQAIEKHLEGRVRGLLAIPTRHLKQEKTR